MNEDNPAAWALERMPDKAAWSKNELSQSKMKDLIDCSFKYKLLRVDRTKNVKQKSASLPMGTAFHNAVEAFHNALRKGIDPDIDLIMEIAKTTFAALWPLASKGRRICIMYTVYVYS